MTVPDEHLASLDAARGLRGSPDQPQILLADLPPTARQTRAALAVAAVLLLGLAALGPFAAKPVPQLNGFHPAIAATMFLADLITASLFLAQFSITRSRALLPLACGFLFSAAIVVANGLTFPNFRVYLLWHLGLPVALFAHIWFRNKDSTKASVHTSTEIAATVGVACVLALVSCIACLALLPRVDPVTGRWFTAITMLTCTAALAVLWVFRRSALDQWLMIVVLTMLVELTITSLIGGLGPRIVSHGFYSLGFYTGRLFSLVTSTVILIAQLAETSRLYAGVARSNMLAGIINASRALSSEMVLPKLIERLMKIAIENAGADRGLLILPSGNGYLIEAEAQTTGDQIEVTMRQQPMTLAVCPESLVHHVIRTRDTVILDDASMPNLFFADDYLRARQPKSLICLPLIKQRELTGILLLENTLTKHAFTPARIAVLELLAAQAGISLENAALYTDLQRNEVFLSQGQQISQTGSFGWNAASQELYWSQGIYSILEYDRTVRASYGLTMDRTHPDDRALFRRVFDDAMSEMKDYDVEHRLLMPDGRVKHVHVIGRAVHTGNLDLVGAVRDITERKRAEEVTHEHERRYHEIQLALEHAGRVATLGQLSASIAHEVNQPLSGAVVSAETALLWLTAEKPNLTEAKKAVTRVVRDGNRAGEVLNRIRSLVKKAPPQKNLLAINDVIREIIALTQGEAARCGVQVQFRLGKELPLIQGDRVQLQQVVLNLMMNALDAIRGAQGTGPREILISTGNADAGGVHVCVRDSGPGIDPASIEHLFDAFYTTKSEGLGMGLPICRSIIELHGGRLWVTPNDPRGAVFQFTLPFDGE